MANPGAILALVFFLFAAPASAAEVDPLWVKTVASYASVSKYVPQDVDSETQTKSGDKTARQKVRSQLSGWANGKPVYRILSAEPAGEFGPDDKPGPGVNVFGQITSALVSLKASTRRLEGQSLDGTPYTLFEVAMSKLGMKVDMKMWVDPVTGVPRQSETKIRQAMLVDALVTVQYAPHPTFGLVERWSDVTTESLVPFMRESLRIMNTPSNWIARPE